MAIMYYAGRIFQLIGLIAMPSAIWVGWIGHNERGCIAIFSASILVFFVGYLLTSLAKK
ncbi:MAG: hypothetical protein HYZ84_02110 [Candidatus Omnitrophica bacterium]|nr:hypothetical protein [Candidatus Omnitrophota bacterium]